MAKVIDYYLFMLSPWAYLGGPRLQEIARRHGAESRVKPIDMAVVYPETGGVPMAKRAPARLDYRLAELRRWRDQLGMTLNIKPAHFPVAHETASRMVIAAGEVAGMAGGHINGSAGLEGTMLGPSIFSGRVAGGWAAHEAGHGEGFVGKPNRD